MVAIIVAPVGSASAVWCVVLRQRCAPACARFAAGSGSGSGSAAEWRQQRPPWKGRAGGCRGAATAVCPLDHIYMYARRLTLKCCCRHCSRSSSNRRQRRTADHCIWATAPPSDRPAAAHSATPPPRARPCGGSSFSMAEAQRDHRQQRQQRWQLCRSHCGADSSAAMDDTWRLCAARPTRRLCRRRAHQLDLRASSHLTPAAVLQPPPMPLPPLLPPAHPSRRSSPTRRPPPPRASRSRS